MKKNDVMYDVLVTDIIAFVAKETGYKVHKLHLHTVINHYDVSISGDDGVELVAAFIEKYGVDMDGFPTEAYFGPEWFHPFMMLTFPMFIICKIIDFIFKIESTKKVFRVSSLPLTIENLCQIVQHGSWEAAKAVIMKNDLNLKSVW